MLTNRSHRDAFLRIKDARQDWQKDASFQYLSALEQEIKLWLDSVQAEIGRRQDAMKSQEEEDADAMERLFEARRDALIMGED